MDPFSFLETTAEIAITFAGFVSLFVVLARRDGSFSPDVALTIRLILLSSISSLFFAALALILAAVGLTAPELWRLASAVFLLVASGIGYFGISNLRRLPPEDQNTIFAWVGHSLGGIAALAAVANTVGWPFPPSPGIYLVSVWLMLGIASLNLLNLVFRHVLGHASP